VAQRLPELLASWVRRRTEQPTERFDELKAEELAFAAAARRLEAELEVLP
jgi:hypothetical protein